MRRASRKQKLRHQILSDWRGVSDGPVINNAVTTPRQLVPELLREWKLDERLRLDEALAAWRDLVGGFIAQHTAPDGWKRGVFTVRMLQPAIHHTLMMEKPRLLQKLQERFGKDVVRELRFRHG